MGETLLGPDCGRVLELDVRFFEPVALDEHRAEDIVRLHCEPEVRIRQRVCGFDRLARVRLGLVQQPFRQRGFREQARKRDPVELVHRVEPRDVLGDGRPGAARPSEQRLQLGMAERRGGARPTTTRRGQQLSCVRRLARGSGGDRRARTSMR